jgi:hypothetical protein
MAEEPTPPASMDDTADDTSGAARRRHAGKVMLVVWVIAIVAIAGGSLVSRSHTFGQDSRTTRFVSGPVSSPDYVWVRARIIDVDPPSDTMTVRLIVEPHGAYALPSGALAVPLSISVDGVPGGSESFPAGRLPVPVQSTVSMVGDLSQYPFDSYRSLLVVEVAPTSGRGLVPVHLAITAGQRDWSVRPSNSAIVQGNALTVDIGVSRGTATLGFALFQMGIMLVLAGIALAITYVTVIAGRQLEFSYFTWLGALIFALPAVRNSLPGGPSIGTLADSLVFFPALATVTMCMLAAAITFVRRSHRKE